MSFLKDAKPLSTQVTSDNFLEDASVVSTAPGSAEDFLSDASPVDTAAVETDSSNITQTELSSIQNKYKLSEDELEHIKGYADVFGGKIEGRESSFGSQLTGFLADSVALGIPQAVMIESQESERMKNALDELRQLAESKKSGLRTIGEIGAGVLVPGTGIAKLGKLGKLATFASVPAIESGAKAERERRGEAAAIGAGTGLALAGVLGAGAKVYRKASDKIKSRTDNYLQEVKDRNVEDEINKIVDSKQPEIDLELKALENPKSLSKEEVVDFLGGQKKFDKLVSKSKDLDVRVEELVQNKRATILSKMERLVRSPVGEEAKKKSIGKVSKEEVDKIYEGFKRQGNLKNIHRETKVREAIPKALESKGLLGKGKEISALSKVAAFFSDNVPLAKVYDHKYGMDSHLLLDEASNKHVQYTKYLKPALEKVADLQKTAASKNLDQNKLYRILNGKDKEVPDQYKDVVGQWRDYFEEYRLLINEMGMPIQKLENYVPNLRLNQGEYKATLINTIKKLEKEYDFNLENLSQSKFNEIKKSSPDFRAVLNEVRFSRGGKVPEKPSQVVGEINKIINDRKHLGQILAMDSFAAKARTDKNIPDLFLEKDLGNLASRWITSTIRAVSYRDVITKMDTYAEVAQKAGDDNFSKFWRDLAMDVKGTRQDTLAQLGTQMKEELKSWALVRAANETNPIRKGMYEFVDKVPEAMQVAMRQVYANYLGWNPKSLLQNIVSPALGAVPDFGSVYGSKNLYKAWGDIIDLRNNGIEIKLSAPMAKALGKQPGEIIKTNKLNIFLQNEGFHPEQWSGEMVDALEGGYKAELGRMSRKAIDELNAKLMWGFEKTELAARAQAVFMGRNIAKDLIEKPELRERILKKIDSPAYQRQIAQALKVGDSETVMDLVPRFINSNNMFNYNKINMSQYGRYMGPLFSVFSKWPTSIAGRIWSDVERKGIETGGENVFRTLMAPYLLLAATDYVTSEAREDSPRARRVVGANGLRSWTPFDAATPFATGEGIGASPAFQTVGEVGTGIARAAGEMTYGDRDTEKATEHLMRGFGSALRTYLPGAGAYRIMKDEVPKVVFDRDPEEFWR